MTVHAITANPSRYRIEAMALTAADVVASLVKRTFGILMLTTDERFTGPVSRIQEALAAERKSMDDLLSDKTAKSTAEQVRQQDEKDTKAQGERETEIEAAARALTDHCLEMLPGSGRRQPARGLSSMRRNA